MSNPNKIEIRSLEDLCNTVTISNVGRLSEDVTGWLVSYIIAIDKIRADNPELCKGLKNADIAKGGFTWVDDGKTDLLGIKIIGSDGSVKLNVDFNDDKSTPQ